MSLTSSLQFNLQLSAHCKQQRIAISTIFTTAWSVRRPEPQDGNRITPYPRLRWAPPWPSREPRYEVNGTVANSILRTAPHHRPSPLIVHSADNPPRDRIPGTHDRGASTKDAERLCTWPLLEGLRSICLRFTTSSRVQRGGVVLRLATTVPSRCHMPQ